jgi:hypothetical protein
MVKIISPQTGKDVGLVIDKRLDISSMTNAGINEAVQWKHNMAQLVTIQGKKLVCTHVGDCLDDHSKGRLNEFLGYVGAITTYNRDPRPHTVDLSRIRLD